MSANNRSAVSTLRQRVTRGVGATAVGPLVTAGIQLIAVPLLLHAWGAQKYGDWLLLTAVPSYFTMSDLGFGDASGSDMTARVAAGDRKGALTTFQSSWVLLSATCAALALIALFLVRLLPWQHWLKLSSLPASEASEIVLVMALYVLAGQQGNLLESGYRCDGNYALGTVSASVMRLIEVVIATAVGVWSGRLLYTAVAYLTIRGLCTIIYALQLRRKSPWLSLGISHARLDSIRRLALPAASFVVLPAAQSLSFQGFTILIGSLLGPLAVATFSTLRTLTRFNSQLIATLSHALWPEFSRAFGAGNISLARRLHRRAYQAALGISLLSSLFLWFGGPFIYHLWIQKSLVFDVGCFHFLVLVSAANSLWATSSVVSMSSNRHHWIATACLISAILSLAAGYFLVPKLGIRGAALSLLLADILMIWIVLRSSLRQLRDTVANFALALLSLPALPGPKEA